MVRGKLEAMRGTVWSPPTLEIGAARIHKMQIDIIQLCNFTRQLK